jgi:hypothetical protein
MELPRSTHILLVLLIILAFVKLVDEDEIAATFLKSLLVSTAFNATATFNATSTSTSTSSSTSTSTFNATKLWAEAELQSPIDNLFDRSLSPRAQSLKLNLRTPTLSAPLQIGVMGGSFTLGQGCAAHIIDSFKECVKGPCLRCAWPTRFSDYLTEIYGPGLFNVVNLASSASCSGCIAPNLSNLLKDARLVKGPDLILFDLSVNDANAFRPSTRSSGWMTDPRRTIFASVEQLIRRILKCDNEGGTSPAIIMMQSPPVSWQGGGTRWYKSNTPVYKLVAERYHLPYFELSDFATKKEMNSITPHFPHPDWYAHELQAVAVTKVLASMMSTSNVDIIAGGGLRGNEENCSKAIIPLEEREKFFGCDNIVTSMGGPNAVTDWNMGEVGWGWGLNHDDVPNHPDKVGWHFEYDGNNSSRSTKTSEIVFKAVITEISSVISMSFVISYENFDYIECRVDGGPATKLIPIWATRASLVRFYGIPAEKPGEHEIRCFVDFDNGRNVTKPFRFKLMAITSC